MDKKLDGKWVVARFGAGYVVKYTTDYYIPFGNAAARAEILQKSFMGKGAKSRAEKYRDEIATK